MVRNLPAMWETWVRSLGREDPLEKELATHSSVLAWRIPWTEEPGGPWGGRESDTTERLPDETAMWGGGERASRHALSCVLREVTLALVLLFFFYSLLAVLDLCCHPRAFSSCCEQGLLTGCSARASQPGGFSCCRAWALGPRTQSGLMSRISSVITGHAVEVSVCSRESVRHGERLRVTEPPCAR